MLEEETKLYTGDSSTADIPYFAKFFWEVVVVSEESGNDAVSNEIGAEGCPLLRARTHTRVLAPAPACSHAGTGPRFRFHKGSAYQGCLPNPASEADPCPVLCVGAAIVHRHCSSCGYLACPTAECSV